ncbi:PH domain-containing protein [Bacillus sp. FJAT-52991]|uniref:PH domain-containing protein n=1 Tax=Bacillus kandeliae TaxID=3129297 RepID=A0ABZ2N2G8_9BACI
MGIYRSICYKVEDVFIKLLTKGQDPVAVKQKVTEFRTQKEALKLEKKKEAQAQSEERKKIQEAKRAEKERLAKEKAEQEHQATLALLSNFVAEEIHTYTDYEYRAVSKNPTFFKSVKDRVFEANEQGITFLECEYDKTKTKEYPGYLFVTNKRVWFVAKNMTMIDKFRYQTIYDVKWFKDGLMEKGLYIQYGKRRLEFDEIFDKDQMQRVANLILNLSSS